MDLISIIMAVIVFGVLLLLGGFLIIAILVIVYLALTGRRWD